MPIEKISENFPMYYYGRLKMAAERKTTIFGGIQGSSLFERFQTEFYLMPFIYLKMYALYVSRYNRVVDRTVFTVAQYNGLEKSATLIHRANKKNVIFSSISSQTLVWHY